MSDQLNTATPARFSALVIAVLTCLFLVSAKYFFSWLDSNQLSQIDQQTISLSIGQAPPANLNLDSGPNAISPTSFISVTAPAREEVEVTRVIDGDTIEIASGQKVRYIGIDTPETHDPRRPVGCFGQQASDKNQELVEGKTVQLEKDVSQTDKYGRLLRYVYVDGQMVNQILVEQGFAKASTYPPDVKYQAVFARLEKQAREAELGLWGQSCKI